MNISEYIKALLKAWCEVAIPEKLTWVKWKITPKNATYFYVWKNGRVAYFQENELDGFSLSVPVPNKSHSLNKWRWWDISVEDILAILTPGYETGWVSDVNFKDYLIRKNKGSDMKYTFLK